MPDFTSVFTQERDHWQQRAETAEAELARLHDLIRRGLTTGQFSSPYAAAARAELREAARTQPGGGR